MPGRCTLLGAPERPTSGVENSSLEDLLGKVRAYKLKKEGEATLLKHLIDEAAFLLREILTSGVQKGCCDNLDTTEELYPLLQPGALEDTKLKIEKFLAFVEKNRSLFLDKRREV